MNWRQAMNILMFEWKIFGKKDIIDSFEHIGHHVKCVTTDWIMDRENDEFHKLFQKEVQEGNYDFVFTINYSPIVSVNCKQWNLKYISIVYDSPLVALDSYTIVNSCNYVF